MNAKSAAGSAALAGAAITLGVGYGIDSVSVDPASVQQVRSAIATAERQLLVRAARAAVQQE